MSTQLVQIGLRLWIACDYCRQTVAWAGIVWDLKGQCHENFDFRFTTWISFPQAPVQVYESDSVDSLRLVGTGCLRLLTTGGQLVKVRV
jgi:hypothetical protein